MRKGGCVSTLVTFVLVMFLWGWAGIAVLAVIGSLSFFLMTKRSGRSRLFGCHLCDGVHLDCCTCFELASKIRGTSTSEDHVFIGSTAGSVARRAMLLSQVNDNRATRSLPRTKKILGQYSDLPTRKVPETLDPAQPQRTGIPMIRPGTGVGR